MSTKDLGLLMVHLGKGVQRHLDYLDKIAGERGARRARIVNEIMCHVLESGMMEELYERIDAAAVGEGRKTHRPVNLDSKPVSQIIGDVVVSDTPPRRTDLPEPSRRALAPPCPELRPHYFRQVAVNPPRRIVEKTKSQLREEIKQAVENTR